MHNGGALCVLPASILLAPGLIGTAIYPAAFRPLTLGLVTGADALTRPAIATSFCSSMVRQNRLVARCFETLADAVSALAAIAAGERLRLVKARAPPDVGVPPA